MGWNSTLGAVSYTFTISAPYFQNTGQNTVAQLLAVACNAGRAGLSSHINNGPAAPALGSLVSSGSTGSTWLPVTCNGTNWVYG
jgi:hypothetical protein